MALYPHRSISEAEQLACRLAEMLSFVLDFCGSTFIGKQATKLNCLHFCLFSDMIWLEVCTGCFILKLTRFPLLFLCLTSHPARSALCSLKWSPSKIDYLQILHGAKRRASPAHPVESQALSWVVPVSSHSSGLCQEEERLQRFGRLTSMWFHAFPYFSNIILAVLCHNADSSDITRDTLSYFTQVPSEPQRPLNTISLIQ